MNTRPDKRNSNGTFAIGNSGGPGRPARVSELDYLRTAAQAVPPERWERIVERAAKDAEAGDWRARQFLAGYVMPQRPKPAEASLAGSLLLLRDDDRYKEQDLDDMTVRQIAGQIPI